MVPVVHDLVAVDDSFRAHGLGHFSPVFNECLRCLDQVGSEMSVDRPIQFGHACPRSMNRTEDLPVFALRTRSFAVRTAVVEVHVIAADDSTERSAKTGLIIDVRNLIDLVNEQLLEPFEDVCRRVPLLESKCFAGASRQDLPPCFLGEGTRSLSAEPLRQC